MIGWGLWGDNRAQARLLWDSLTVTASWGPREAVKPLSSSKPTFLIPRAETQLFHWLGFHLVQGLWVQTSGSWFSLRPHCLQPAQGWGPGGAYGGQDGAEEQ